ncbi:hypothetical protein GJAV_G00041430 [Gymnothorax javanicus]|nr:hypothetical protein GJAV_G00041430 [Gymnothorax javanicus]
MLISHIITYHYQLFGLKKVRKKLWKDSQGKYLDTVAIFIQRFTVEDTGVLKSIAYSQSPRRSRVPKVEERLTILGEQHKCSDITSFADSHKEGSMVSGYSLDMVTPIGSPTHDSWFRMPPIKTWPPIDSWSDTCSNIVHIVLSSADEPPAVVIQTLEVMAIKDKEVEPHQTQTDTKTAERMCVITAVKDSSEVTAERRVKKVQPRLEIQTADAHSPVCGDKEDWEMPCSEEHTSQVTSEEARCSSPPCALAPQNLCERDITEILPSTENTTPAVSCDVAANITTIKGQMFIGREDLEIHEDSHRTRIDSQTSQACLEKKPETEALRKVTEDTLSALYEDIKETAARRRSHESLTFSSYSSQLSAKKPKPRKSLSSDTVPQRAAGTFQRLTRAPAPKSRGTQAEETDKGRRHVFETKDGKQPTESKHQKSVLGHKEKQVLAVAAGHRRAYNEVVKQKPQAPKEVPKVLQHIKAEKLSGDPGSISLQCQFSAVSVQSSVQWTREGAVLEESKRSAGEERILSYIILKPSSKDLGRYQCCVSCPLGTLTSEFYLTSNVLSELVPSSDHQAVEVVDGVEEDVKCSPLLFRDDFLSEQYFGENQPASILTEQYTMPSVKGPNTVQSSLTRTTVWQWRSVLYRTQPGNILKPMKEWPKSAAEFGEVPEIIPILLVHRPSSDIPYATLEEELIGDFVKYSVKDGKEINLTRRDSEPGQKCCAFQHWVYDKTEGNLLVTDMQGVGMKLTDVGIATPKKGYKGFKGNCATSFIEQFKSLHQCNKFCELLGLKPLQAGQTKPRRTQPASNPKPSPQPKKKPFTINLKSKS